jgi:hypothetical protein
MIKYLLALLLWVYLALLNSIFMVLMTIILTTGAVVYGMYSLMVPTWAKRYFQRDSSCG